MDVLSLFLSLYAPQGMLDTRCSLRAPWEIDHENEEPGVASYHIVLSGMAKLAIAGRPTVNLSAGDIVVLSHGSAHRLFAPQDVESQHESLLSEIRVRDDNLPVTVKDSIGTGEACDILCGRFIFAQPTGQALLATLPELLLVQTKLNAEFSGLKALTGMLRAETTQMRPGAKMLISQLSSVLFGLLIRAWTDEAKITQGVLGALAERRLQPAMAGMFLNMKHNWTLEELAHICHMSRATFVRLFQKAAHGTAASTLQQIRMAQAAQWLLQDDRPISVISEEVGYQSEAAFSRLFKKFFKTSPGSYRKDFKLF